MVKLTELAAIWEAQQGNNQPLADRVRDGKPLDQSTRNVIADLLEGKSLRPAHRPRKEGGNLQEMFLAAMVNAVKQEDGVPLKSNRHGDGALLIVGKQYGKSESSMMNIWKKWKHLV